MTDLIKVRSQYIRNLDQSLLNVVEHLKSKPEVVKIILFGSYAKNRRDLFTDLDLIVVMDSEKDFTQRTAQLYSEIDLSVDMDMLVYTPDEYKKLRRGRFMSAVQEEGRVLYERKP
jgi:predicted nucleotidyltransferase